VSFPYRRNTTWPSVAKSWIPIRKQSVSSLRPLCCANRTRWLGYPKINRFESSPLESCLCCTLWPGWKRMSPLILDCTVCPKSPPAHLDFDFELSGENCWKSSRTELFRQIIASSGRAPKRLQFKNNYGSRYGLFLFAGMARRILLEKNSWTELLHLEKPQND